MGIEKMKSFGFKNNFNLERLDNIFSSFINKYEEICLKKFFEKIKEDNDDSYFFDFDELTWKAKIKIEEFYFNDEKYLKNRHKLDRWYIVNNPEIFFNKILDFKNKLGIISNIICFINDKYDRLDIQCKDFTNNLSLSITYEYHCPYHDFDDDLWTRNEEE